MMLPYKTESTGKTIHFKSGNTMQIDQELFESIVAGIEKSGQLQINIVRDSDEENAPNRLIVTSEIEYID